MLHICDLSYNFLIGSNIKNIIFDLGGVLLGLDVNRTYSAFSSLSGISESEIASKFSNEPLFFEYEKGSLSDDRFRDGVRALLRLTLTDSQIDQAWNAMLLTIEKEKFALLKQLKNSHQTFLLSNTNAIHLKAVNEVVFKTDAEPNLNSYFHRSYYSHLIHLRKPDKEIFEHVLNENKLVANQTLFLDDTEANVTAAAQLGIHSVRITSIHSILSLTS
ncbi:MAG: HAD family phosphatase [Bacteroidetes bacterium]|nr:HAD family phosphatase [Bacteroidota bacterium]